MDMLKKFFPLSFVEEVAELVKVIIVYLIVGIVAGFVIGLLGKIPLIGWIFTIVGSLVDLYVVAGIVIALLAYFKVLK